MVDGVSQNYKDFYERTISQRRHTNFPPFTHLLKLTCVYKTEAAAIRSVATPFGVNLPAQAAATTALGEGELARTAERSAAVAAERDRVVEALRTQGWQVPEAQGNFFWLGVGPETTALAEHFRGAGILVRPFAGEGVRVSVGTTSDNERVLAAAAAWCGAH